jgi:hypothetical protein
MPPSRVEISGNGQIFQSNEFICNVTFSCIQIGSPKGEVIRADGKLLIEESKRKLPEVLDRIRRLPVELRIDSGEIVEIIAFKLDGNMYDGKYSWVTWEVGKI